jgi:PhnB protein
LETTGGDTDIVAAPERKYTSGAERVQVAEFSSKEVPMAVKAIPDGYHTITPYLTVQGVADLIAFVRGAFDAQVRFQMSHPDGSIGHAEVQIGNSVIMMGEARGDWKPMPAALYLYVEDTDAVYRRALAAGATSLREPEDQFYGDRNAGVKDSAGNYWWIATHVEDVSPEELKRRSEAYASQKA